MGKKSENQTEKERIQEIERLKRFTWDPRDVIWLRYNGKWVSDEAREEVYQFLRASGIKDPAAWIGDKEEEASKRKKGQKPSPAKPKRQKRS